MPCVVCDHLFTQIDGGNDSDINENNYCDIYGIFSASEPFCPPYGNAACIQLHEDAHYDEWLGCLEDQEEAFDDKPSMDDMAIECDNANTVNCQAARLARKSAIEADVLQAWIDAGYAWNALGEAYAIAQAQHCYLILVGSICSVWDCENCD